jgi:hypothetical protein
LKSVQLLLLLDLAAEGVLLGGSSSRKLIHLLLVVGVCPQILILECLIKLRLEWVGIGILIWEGTELVLGVLSILLRPTSRIWIRHEFSFVIVHRNLAYIRRSRLLAGIGSKWVGIRSLNNVLLHLSKYVTNSLFE